MLHSEEAPEETSGKSDEIESTEGSDEDVMIIRESLECLVKNLKSVMNTYTLDQSIPIMEMQNLYLKGQTAVQQVIDDGDLPEDNKILSEVKCLLIDYHGVLSKYRKIVKSQQKNVDSPKNTPVDPKKVDNVMKKLNIVSQSLYLY